MQLHLSRQLLALSLCLCAFNGALLAQKIQINAEAQQKAFADARALVPDTLQWDFSQVKEIYLDEFADEIDQWVIDAIKAIGLDTAKAVLNAPREMLIEKADLEEETVDHLLEVLRAEFE